MDSHTEPSKLKERKFKSFNETFPLCAFALAFALIYPNRSNIRARLIVAIIIIILNLAELFWFTYYLLACLFRADFYNFSRNITVGIIVILFFFKSFYINWKIDEFGTLLNKISSDLIVGNSLDSSYQDIYESFLMEAKKAEKVWVIIPIILSSQFPLYAMIRNIYESINSDVGTRFMAHDIEMKFIEDRQYDSPYFELVFAYNLIQCIVLVPNFTGFDGSFCIATTHLRMKLKLVVHKLNKAFTESKCKVELRARVKETIKDHQVALDFYRDIQNVYGGWLFAVFLLTGFIISFNLYQININDEFDPKYAIFALSGVIHIYAPCYFASNLIKLGDSLCSEIYSVPWEAWSDPITVKTLTFIIARTQQQLILTGKGMVIFNLELFVSILQTTYSFYTLITS